MAKYETILVDDICEGDIIVLPEHNLIVLDVTKDTHVNLLVAHPMDKDYTWVRSYSSGQTENILIFNSHFSI